MINNFVLLIDRLNDLIEETHPKWGIIRFSQMIFHCNTFIGVSIGERQKTSFSLGMLKGIDNNLPNFEELKFMDYIPLYAL